MSTEVPIIETERLRLRAHRRDDYPHCCAMWADPIVTRFIGGKPSTPQQTWSRLLTYLGHWRIQEYGYWAIEEKISGAFIGEAGFADFKRDIDEPMRNVPELGFALVSSAHGKGYATEVIRAILEWGERNLPSARTVALVNEANTASLRILNKFGYRPFEHATYNDSQVIFLERVSPTTTRQSSVQT